MYLISSILKLHDKSKFQIYLYSFVAKEDNYTKLARESEIRYCTVAMVTDYDCWHPDHEEVDVSIVIKTLQKNASNAQNMIKEVIKTFKDYSIEKDPANDCLDVAIITDPKLRTKKTIKKLKNIAGRVLKK